MNKDNAKNYLPLVQALADGKVIQVLVADDTWEDLNSPAFTRPARCYRIKPEPREVWITFSPSGHPIDVQDKEPAWLPINSRGQADTTARYREVIE